MWQLILTLVTFGAFALVYWLTQDFWKSLVIFDFITAVFALLSALVFFVQINENPLLIDLLGEHFGQQENDSEKKIRFFLKTIGVSFLSFAIYKVSSNSILSALYLSRLALDYYSQKTERVNLMDALYLELASILVSLVATGLTIWVYIISD